MGDGGAGEEDGDAVDGGEAGGEEGGDGEDFLGLRSAGDVLGGVTPAEKRQKV